MDYVGKTAIVTGGANGIGEATAQRLAELGASVAIFDVNDRGREVAKRLLDDSREARFFHCDLSKEGDITSAISAVMETYHRIDVLVNDAGVTLPKGFEVTSPAEWDGVQAVNLRAQFLMMRGTAAELRRTAGAVVNVASFHAQATIEHFAAYAASKSGVIGLTRSSALDLAGDGVRVNAVCPGIIETAMWQEWLDTVEDRVSVTTELLKLQPLGRIGTPREVANAIAFLASDEASYITGAVLYVDGGVTARLSHV
jgi:NAD(P)-dependent dehydrogenase (short-subunit alcohol dehydrogenase family)